MTSSKRLALVLPPATGGDKAGTDALNLVRAQFAAQQDGRFGRFKGGDLQTRIERFQILSSPGQGAAGSNASNEAVNLPAVSAQISGLVVSR
jgi:hypothetical protein